MDIFQEFDQAIYQANTSLNGIFNMIKDKIKEKERLRDKRKTKVIEVPCGLEERKPYYTPQDIAAINMAEIDFKADLKENCPDTYQEINPGDFNVGGGTGSYQEVFPFDKLDSYPKWISELESEARIYKRRNKGKSGIDIMTATHYGVVRRAKEKIHRREKTLYVILDVSGSMWGYKYKGKLMLQWMISYFPPMARKFEGELWFVESGKPSKQKIQLGDIRKKHIQELRLKGGGGTNYDAAFREIAAEKKRLKEEGFNPNFLTVVFSDAEVHWPTEPGLLPEDLVIVAPAIQQKLLPPDNPKKRQKSILVDIEVD